MSKTQGNVYHYVSSVAFLLINVIVTIAIIVITRISAVEKALAHSRVRLT